MAKHAELLPREDLVVTGPLDQGDWNYQGVVGWASRQRFDMVTRLLGTTVVDRLLEVGYGSGLFMPELARHTVHLDGVDVHLMTDEVEEVLAVRFIKAELRTGTIHELPYSTDTFDTIVIVSTLEFVDDLDEALTEVARVLKPSGQLVVVTPGSSPVLDFALKLATGERAEDTFQGRRQEVQPALRRHFTVERSISLPPLVPRAARLYTTLMLRNTRP